MHGTKLTPTASEHGREGQLMFPDQRYGYRTGQDINISPAPFLSSPSSSVWHSPQQWHTRAALEEVPRSKDTPTSQWEMKHSELRRGREGCLEIKGKSLWSRSKVWSHSVPSV